MQVQPACRVLAAAPGVLRGSGIGTPRGLWTSEAESSFPGPKAERDSRGPDPVTRASPVVRLPARTLPTLADRCAEAGPEGVAALREAGRVAGEELLRRVGADPSASEPGEFWEAVGQEFVDVGLGPLSYSVREPGVGEIRLEGSPEADGVDGEPRRRTGCAFSTGVLGGLLTGAAGQPVAVLEVECRAGGSAFCRFLVGDGHRLRAIRDRLGSGESLARALEAR